MNITSRAVLVAAALVASPALFHALVTGTVTMDAAAQRYGIAVLAAWVALSALSMMVGPVIRPAAAAATVTSPGATTGTDAVSTTAPTPRGPDANAS